jgi:hypothetical protein
VVGNPKRRQDIAFLNQMPEEMIFSMVESGKSIANICIELGISKRALDDWIEENDHGAMITRARTRAADLLACETIEIADSMADSNPQRDVQRIRTRQWLAERWDQKTYGLQKAAQVNINIQDLRMAALRHTEVLEDLSTENRND